jgi:hypothetical protein
LQAHFGRLSATWAEPWDIYFLARAAAMDRSFAALGEAFAALLEQADLR